MWKLHEAVAGLTPGYLRVGCSPWHLASNRCRDLLEKKVFGFSDEFTGLSSFILMAGMIF